MTQTETTTKYDSNRNNNKIGLKQKQQPNMTLTETTTKYDSNRNKTNI